MTVLKKLCVSTGEYQKNGETKKRWKVIGHLHEYEGREYITLDATFNLAAVPRKPGDDRVSVNLFEADDKRQKAEDLPDENIPF